MRVELPDLKRCCFCIPLRRGLIGWGYVRLAIDILVIIYGIFSTFWIFAFHVTWIRMAIYIVWATYFIMDTVFTMLLVVASHKKSARLLRISFIYGVVWLVLFLALGAYLTYCRLSQELQYSYLDSFYGILLGLITIFVIFFVQVYLLILTHSEEKKLRNQQLEMQFVNNAADGEARCVYAGEQNTAQHTDIDREIV